MEQNIVKEKLQHFLQKYKYVALIVLVGIVLMWMPNGKENISEPGITPTMESILSVEEKLAQILELEDGAG